jgi:hypothetical protein
MVAAHVKSIVREKIFRNVKFCVGEGMNYGSPGKSVTLCADSTSGSISTTPDVVDQEIEEEQDTREEEGGAEEKDEVEPMPPLSPPMPPLNPPRQEESLLEITRRNRYLVPGGNRPSKKMMFLVNGRIQTTPRELLKKHETCNPWDLKENGVY